jgi:DNA polymerase
MIAIRLASSNDFEAWRARARQVFHLGLPPEDLEWCCPETAPSLFGTARADGGRAVFGRSLSVPRTFMDAGRRVICHLDPERFSRLYRLLWRLQDDRSLLSRMTDDDVRWLQDRDKAIRRDVHKMHAFVRFRKLGECAGREGFTSWFEPSHRVTELTAPFFVRRFHGMDWAILTPHARAVWHQEKLSFGPGARRDEVPVEDAIEDQWKTYFSAIFNPARLKIAAMTAEMPKKYWRNLPEAECIPTLIREAKRRREIMQRDAVTGINPRAAIWKETKMQFDEQPAGIDSLSVARDQIDGCRRCPLFSNATQGVFGEGPDDARLMIVGEQPGDQEDLAGRPFVGPAGQLLDRALADADIDRDIVYLTNAVKHFKFEARGKRRIHQRPNAGEIDHCRWWLNIERMLIRPDLIIALGASAIRGVLGKTVTVKSLRGRPLVHERVHLNYEALLGLDRVKRTVAGRHDAGHALALGKLHQ